ncbi:MAG: 2-succinyl-5-enolpyruvyl-6-hydroxy-3-cyclohexene-1-carboxylic-acid synthase [Actinobacteria bacterium]|nr:MAG: 2-succinyl-5-enolpyruvyl-6-hydroxy-3-cyclohexene-1-carboxylic-acid synthase [Actinomycetota bacterium]
MDSTNRNTALASALVEELARCGVRRAALAPGSRSTPLALALWHQPAIEVAVIVDERSAGYFALGAAQGGGRPAIVLCTSGTAAANLHPAVCEADEAGVPLIALTADRPAELRGIGAGQTIDQLKLYGSAVRWFCEVGNHEADDAGLLHFRSVACHAYAAARGEPRPGPVHLNLAWRDPLGPEPHPEDVTATSPLALEGRGERPLTAVASDAPLADEALIDELAERVSASPRGLVIAGRQLDDALAGPLTALAERAGYPILAESWWSASAICRPARRFASGSPRLGSCVRSWSTRPSDGTSPRTGRRRSCGRRRGRWPADWPTASRKAGRTGGSPGWRPGGRRRRRWRPSSSALRSRRSLARTPPSRDCTRTATSSTRPPRCPSATPRRSSRPPPRG